MYRNRKFKYRSLHPVWRMCYGTSPRRTARKLINNYQRIPFAWIWWPPWHGPFKRYVTATDTFWFLDGVIGPGVVGVFSTCRGSHWWPLLPRAEYIWPVRMTAISGAQSEWRKIPCTVWRMMLTSCKRAFKKVPNSSFNLQVQIHVKLRGNMALWGSSTGVQPKTNILWLHVLQWRNGNDEKWCLEKMRTGKEHEVLFTQERSQIVGFVGRLLG